MELISLDINKRGGSDNTQKTIYDSECVLCGIIMGGLQRIGCTISGLHAANDSAICCTLI